MYSMIFHVLETPQVNYLQLFLPSILFLNKNVKGKKLENVNKIKVPFFLREYIPK